MRHLVIDLSGGRAVLSGSIAGRKLLSALIASTRSVETPTPAFLDFDEVEVATASFLREAVIGFRDYARQSLPNVYPVVANLLPAVAEELDFFVRARGDALWSCELDGNDCVVSARLIGELDPAQRSTFEAVVKLGAVTAPELTVRFASQGIGPTAWNNRLSALATKGLLVERKQGKAKSFSPLLEIA
ncbi:hypothetical protein [Aureimonas ureilytica]|uniref:hypothetical protein n=1 Tax=Aureimonas ureilytica TaxID=401562 RepID=UPI0009DB9086|nr:hypothetical protein [Aureimonas ureilytica]